MQLRLYELHYNLGHVLHRQGNLAGAAASYRQTLALNPAYVYAYHSLGLALDEQGQLLAAIDYYQQAIALQPSYIKPYNNLGCALTKLDRLEEAVQVYQQAIALQPDWAILHNNLGQACADRDPEAAIAAYRQAIALQPDLSLAHHNLGKALQIGGQHQQAIACFQRVAAGAALSDSGASWMALGNWQRVLECFQQAIALQAPLVQAYCDWAAGLQGQDDLTQARIACAHFLRLLLQRNSFGASDTAEIFTALAETYLHLANTLITYGGKEQYQQAERYYQQALRFQPTHLLLYLKLADCLMKQQRFNAAIWVCHFALTLHPQHPQLHTQLGYLVEQQEQWEKAIARYQPTLQQAGQKQEPFAPQKPVSPNSHVACADRCPGLNCAPCLQRIFARFDLIHLGNGVHSCTGQSASLPPVPRWAERVTRGIAWAKPQQNAWQICNAIAILTADHERLSDFSRAYPGQLPDCQASTSVDHRSYSSIDSPEPVVGTVAALAGLSGHNYFHWMVDILPRLEILRQQGINWSKIDWFWINSLAQPFQQETLKKLGIPLDRVLESDRHACIQADRLLVPSFAGHLGWLEPWALEFLRQSFLPADDRVPIPKRIYVSRAQAHHRRVLNEAEVLQALLPLGFVSVALEKLSFAEQVALFSQAEVIIAPHGGGLTNLLFCRPGTTVVELVAARYIRHYYWVIGAQLRLRYYFLASGGLTCHPIRQLMYPSPLTEDIWVDLDALKQLIHRLKL